MSPIFRQPRNSATFGANGEITAVAQGFEATRKNLRDFTDDMAQKAVRSAMASAGGKIKDAMQAKIASLPLKESEGFLYDSIGVKVKTYYRRSGSTYNAFHVAIIGPRTDATFVASFGSRAGRVSRPAKYAHLIDRGVKPHAVGRSMHPGFAAIPFVQPALLAGSSAATAAFTRSLALSLRRFRRRQPGGAR